MKNKLLLFLLIAATFPEYIHAQTEQHFGNAGFYYSIGYQRPALSDLNQLLEQNAFPEIPTDFLSADITLYVEDKRMLYQFEHSFCNQSNTSGNIQTFFSNTGYSIVLGYDLIKKNEVGLYTIFGGVLNTGDLEISKAVEENTDFEQLLHSVDNQLGFSLRSHWFTYGIQFHYYAGEFILGLKAGYSGPFLKTDNWKVNHFTSLTNGVEINPGGFYGRIIIGFRIINNSAKL